MKLTEFLENVGRPVAYYPSLARALGGVKQAVFLCQIIYWTGKGTDADGWIYKTSEELEIETGLSYKEQSGARRALVELGVLEEWNQRLIHRMNYRVNKDALNALWEERFSPSDETAFPETTKGHFGNLPNGSSGSDKRSGRYRGTENTPETTAKSTSDTFSRKKKSSGVGGARQVIDNPTTATYDPDFQDFGPDDDYWGTCAFDGG